MYSGTINALTNPGMALIFSAAFFIIWRHQRHQRYIALLSAAFLSCACAFFLQYFTIFGFTASKVLSNALFLVGGVTLATGILARYDRRPPIVALVLFPLIGFSVFAWFFFMEPSLTYRIYAINFCFGAMAIALAAELARVTNRQFIDNALLAALAFKSIVFFVRPIVAVWIDGPYDNYLNFHDSLYWTLLTFSTSFFLPVLALLLITAIALEAIDKLRKESLTDPLSGLLNRRGFEEGAAEALRTAHRKQMPAALVICDLDHFKSINDTWGHLSGDEVISAFADCLRGCVGSGHVIGRVGGEEFAVLLRGANIGVGRLFAEGARTAFAVLKIPGLPSGTRLSASFGVAEWQAGESVASLFRRADAALYQAKNDGRDCVRVELASPSAAGPRQEQDALQADLASNTGGN